MADQVQPPARTEAHDADVRSLTLPLSVSVPIAVVVALPAGLWWGAWTLPLFPAFVVWTEYFVLGARPSVLRVIVPAYLLGAIAGTASIVLSLAVDQALDGRGLITPGDVGWFVGLFLAFIPAMHAITYLPVLQGEAGLPYFNGITMGMATYFVGGYADYGGLAAPGGSLVLVPLITLIPAVLSGLGGAALGWFNVAIMSPVRLPRRRRR